MTITEVLPVKEQSSNAAKPKCKLTSEEKLQRRVDGMMRIQYNPSKGGTMSPLLSAPVLPSLFDVSRRREINQRFDARLMLAEKIARARVVVENRKLYPIKGDTNQVGPEDTGNRPVESKLFIMGRVRQWWTRHRRRTLLRCNKVFNFIRGHENISYLDVDSDALAIQEREDVEKFIIDLGTMLTVYGSSFQRMEYHTVLIAASYGLHCACNVTDSRISYSFSDVLSMNDGDGVSPSDVISGVTASSSSSILKERDLEVQQQYDAQMHQVEDDQVDSIVRMQDNGFTTMYSARIGNQFLDHRKLAMLEQLADNVSIGKMTIDSASDKLKRVIQYHPFFHHEILVAISGIILSVCFSVIMDCNPIEMLSVFLSSLFASPMHVASQKFQVLGKVSMALFSLISVVFALVMQYFFLNTHFVAVPMVALTSVLPFMHTHAFTTGITEMSVRSSATSGIVRLIGVLLDLIQVVFMGSASLVLHGIVFPGRQLATIHSLWRHHDLSYIAAILIGSICFSFLHRKPKDILTTLWLLCSCLLSFYAAQLLTLLIGTLLAVLFVSVLVTIASNIYSRISRHPSVFITSIAILFIFSGAYTASTGVRNHLQYSGLDTESCLSLVSQLGFVSVAIATGLVAGNLFLPQAKKVVI